MFKGQPPEKVVSMLLKQQEYSSSALHYHAIEIYIRFYQWEKALDLAKSIQQQQQNGSSSSIYVDIVLWYRYKYLKESFSSSGTDSSSSNGDIEMIIKDREIIPKYQYYFSKKKQKQRLNYGDDEEYDKIMTSKIKQLKHNDAI